MIIRGGEGDGEMDTSGGASANKHVNSAERTNNDNETVVRLQVRIVVRSIFEFPRKKFEKKQFTGARCQ